MAKHKFIYAQDGNNDALCWPVANFLGFVHAADTQLILKFKPHTNDASDVDQITLVIQANSEKKVIKDIVKAINNHYGEDMIVVADNVNQVYINSFVTDVSCQSDT